MIYVQVREPITVDDEFGREWDLTWQGRGTWIPIPLNVYRRHRWAGDLKRNLELMRLPSGATYWRDRVWHTNARVGGAPKVWITALPVERGGRRPPCNGCGHVKVED